MVRDRKRPLPPPPEQPTPVNGSYQVQEIEVQVKTQPSEWTVYQAPRRLDAMTAPDLTETCSEMLLTTPYLILDLADTILLASAGLAALAKINRAADEQNGELRVVNCSEDVMRVIKMVRFDKVLALYSDIDEAVKINQ